MTLRTNARLAGFTFLFYIAAGISSMALAGRTQATDVLTLCTSFSALVLAVTLYAITREQDPDLALLAMACRVIESIPGRDGEVFFAVGSLLFCWLLLSGRMIPLPMARLGVLASLLLVVILPLQRVGWLGGVMSWSSRLPWLIWLPMLIFEIAFALWLLVKGVNPPARRTA
jgi:Domain of unknown function (DUF4386)